MPSVSLPENPSIEHLRSQAKLLQQLVRAGDEGALSMLAEFHPRFGGREGPEGPSAEALAAFKRSDAQLAVARLYGFASWNRLRDHVAEVESFARPDIADMADVESGSEADVVERFVRLSCVSYGRNDPSERLAQARTLLADDAELASASPAAMAVAGNHRALARYLDAESSSGDTSTAGDSLGPNRWPLILYVAYSRLSLDTDQPAAGPKDAGSPDAAQAGLETARLLLERGADANAGFLWRGLVPPFTALTGAFGWGENDQPPHRDRLALARLLLEAGADPNDGQTLYNNGLGGSARDDHRHLELLVEFGLGTDQNGPWYQRFGDRLTAPSELLYDELEVAAHRGLPNRMRYLIGLDLDLTRGVGRSGQTPRALATRKGHHDVVEILAEAGAAS